MTCAKILIVGPSAAIALALTTPANADSVRISGLADINFGSIAALVDQSSSQNVAICSYRNNPKGLPYSITALGSGPGGTFQIASGVGVLPFDVQWADAPGQMGGIQLQAGLPSSGHANGSIGFDCPLAPDTATLIVTVRAADLGVAQAGSYTGSLQLTIAPE